MRALGWSAILSAGLGALGLAHCTGARDPLNSRVAALEQRVGELERGDASSPLPEVAFEASVDAPANWNEPVAIADASQVPAWTDAGLCQAEARLACGGRLIPAASASRRAPYPGQSVDAGTPLVWLRALDLDSPEGQGCLREQRESCERNERKNLEQQELQAKRMEEFFRWLDGQVSPNRIDVQFSRRVETRALQAFHRDASVPPKLNVSCVLEFCRIEYEVHAHRPDPGPDITGSLDWPPLSSLSRIDPTNPLRYTLYVTRPGWAMPPPPMRSRRGRDSRFRTR